MDNKQQIYDAGSDVEKVLEALSLRRVNLTLLGAYRCCPYIVDLASLFLNDSREIEAYKNLPKPEQTERERPLYYIASDFNDEMRRLIEVLNVRLSKGAKIAIIVRKNKQIYGLANALREAGIEVEDKAKIDFDNSTPKLLTFEGSKGLTFDTVLMPRLVKSSFTKVAESRIDKLIFVGITRAMKWVYMSCYDSENFENLNRLNKTENRKFLTIQKSGETPIVKNYSPPIREDNEDLLDLL
jgi:superfamily I DNA/RNA helicase